MKFKPIFKHYPKQGLLVITMREIESKFSNFFETTKITLFFFVHFTKLTSNYVYFTIQQ